MYVLYYNYLRQATPYSIKIVCHFMYLLYDNKSKKAVDYINIDIIVNTVRRPIKTTHPNSTLV